MSGDSIDQTSHAPLEVNHSDYKVYKPSTAAVAPQSLPDSFFNPDVEDLKNAQAVLTARTQRDAPLQLRATREAAKKAKSRRWPNTTIRIKFSDRTQIEKVFSSGDRISAVYEFCRSLLGDDVKETNFILSQSPPKREFKEKESSSLEELQLAPSSVLLLRFEDDSLNRSDSPAPLLRSVAAQAIPLPGPRNFEENVVTSASKSNKSRSTIEKKVASLLGKKRK